MRNPIMQMLNASSPMARNGNNVLGRIAEIKRAINGQPADALFNRMMHENPQFAQFVQQNQGKSPEQILRDYGLDANLLQSILR